MRTSRESSRHEPRPLRARGHRRPLSRRRRHVVRTALHRRPAAPWLGRLLPRGHRRMRLRPGRERPLDRPVLRRALLAPRARARRARGVLLLRRPPRPVPRCLARARERGLPLCRSDAQSLRRLLDRAAGVRRCPQGLRRHRSRLHAAGGRRRGAGLVSRLLRLARRALHVRDERRRGRLPAARDAVRLGADRAARRARVLARRSRHRRRTVHDRHELADRQLPRNRQGQGRRPAPAARPAGAERPASAPGRFGTGADRPARAERLGGARRRRRDDRPGGVPFVHPGVEGGARVCEGDVRRDAERLVQRPDAVLPRERPAGARARDRFRQDDPGRRGPAGVRRRGRRARGPGGDREPLRPARACGPRARCRAVRGRGRRRRSARARAREPGCMRIGLVSTMCTAVPPPRAGSVELVVGLLAAELTRRGHDVTVFAAGDSEPAGRLVSVLETGYQGNETIWDWQLAEFVQLGRAYEHADELDVISSHVYCYALPFSRLVRTPTVHTFHIGPTPDFVRFCRLYPEGKYLLISEFQRTLFADLPVAGVVPNGIETSAFPFREQPGEYLAYIGAFHPNKGPLEAIRAAREAGVSIRLGGPDSEYFQQAIAPELDGSDVEYVGEVDHAGKVELLGNALALIFSSTWD